VEEHRCLLARFAFETQARLDSWPKTLRVVPLLNEPLLLLAAKNARGSTATLLGTQPYIRYDQAAWGGRHAAAWPADHGIEPAVLCDLDALEAIAA
jgi:hypothetical protein